jgi:hypothetical protein
MSTEANKEAVDDLYDSVDPVLAEREEELAKLNTEEVDATGVQEAVEDPDGEVESSDESHETEPVDEVPAGDATDSGEDDGGGEEAEPTEPEFDPVLLAAVGLGVEQAKAQFGTPLALKNAVRLLDAKAVGIAQTFEEQQQLQQQQQQEAWNQQNQHHQQQQPHPPQQTPTPVEPGAEFKMPETADGEPWDEDVQKLVKEMNAAFDAKLAARLAEQQAVIDQQRQTTDAFLHERQVAERKKYVQEFDGFVNKLGGGWEKVLGKGDGFAMDPNSAEVKARIHLDNVAQQLTFGRRQQQLPDLPQDELLKRALTVAFPEVQEQAVRKEVEEEVGKRHRLMTQRPGGKRMKHKTGEASAAKYAENWYRDRGMASGPVDDFKYDEV